MQTSGWLRRPLFDVIKSIGSGRGSRGAEQQQWRQYSEQQRTTKILPASSNNDGGDGQPKQQRHRGALGTQRVAPRDKPSGKPEQQQQGGRKRVRVRRVGSDDIPEQLQYRGKLVRMHFLGAEHGSEQQRSRGRRVGLHDESRSFEEETRPLNQAAGEGSLRGGVDHNRSSPLGHRERGLGPDDRRSDPADGRKAFANGGRTNKRGRAPGRAAERALAPHEGEAADPPSAGRAHRVARRRVVVCQFDEGARGSASQSFERGSPLRYYKTEGGASRTGLPQEAEDVGTSAPGIARRRLLRRGLTREVLAKDTVDVENSEQFEAVFQRAAAGKKDDKLLRWAQYKDSGDLKPSYFAAYAGSFHDRLLKKVRRWGIQKDRYGIEQARNWRSVLDLMDAATASGETRHKRRMETVSLPEGVRAKFIISAGEVIVELMNRTGSHLQLLPMAHSTPGTFNSVSMWGSPAQNEHARMLLPRYVEVVNEAARVISKYSLDTKVERDLAAEQDAFRTDEEYWREQDDGLGEIEMDELEEALGDITYAPSREPVPIRAVWTATAGPSFTPPEVWTELTINAYFEDLTAKFSRLALIKVYGHGSPESDAGHHVAKVIAELVRVITDRKLMHKVSGASLDTAFLFILQHNNWPAIRKIIVTLEDRQYEFTASNFDALFEAAAKEESVPNFLYNLRHLIRKGFRPTTRTWAAFHLLMSKRFPLDANHVTETMRRKGLFGNLDVAKSVAAVNVRHALTAHLSLGNSFEDFLLRCEAVFGPPEVWLGPSFANKAAHVLLSRGEIEEAIAIVRRMEAYAREKTGRTGSTVLTLNTFLGAAKKARSMQSALSYLRLFAPEHDSDHAASKMAPIGSYPGMAKRIKPEQVSFAILFGVAWDTQHYNVLRVIWRHACVKGYVTYAMQEKMQYSLATKMPELKYMGPSYKPRESAPSIATNMNKLRAWLAGKFCQGISQGLNRKGRAQPVTMKVQAKRNAFGEESLLPLSDINAMTQGVDMHGPIQFELWPRQLINDDLDFRPRNRLARAMLQEDLNEVGSLEPRNNLLLDLEAAWRLDEEWHARGLGTYAGFRDAERACEGDVEKLQILGKTVLEQMLEEAFVPKVKVGDAAGVARVKGLLETGVLQKFDLEKGVGWKQLDAGRPPNMVVGGKYRPIV